MCMNVGRLAVPIILGWRFGRGKPWRFAKVGVGGGSRLRSRGCGEGDLGLRLEVVDDTIDPVS